MNFSKLINNNKIIITSTITIYNLVQRHYSFQTHFQQACPMHHALVKIVNVLLKLTIWRKQLLIICSLSIQLCCTGSQGNLVWQKIKHYTCMLLMLLTVEINWITNCYYLIENSFLKTINFRKLIVLQWKIRTVSYY